MTTRRTVLRGVAGAALGASGLTSAGLTSGCASARAVQVAVVWSDTELQRFEQVLDAYPTRVDVLPVSDNIDAFLRARQRTGSLPDVAVLSRPGLVAEYARHGWLSPLDHLADRFAAPWNNLLRHDGHLYGVWVKAAHKSLIWYRPGSPRLRRLPASGDGLTAFRDSVAETIGGRAGQTPLALGAADGWVLTDWFENVLAATDPEIYDALARGEQLWPDPAVVRTLDSLATVWGTPTAFPGGADRALLTQFAESVIQVAQGDAAAVAGADFAAAVAGEHPLVASRFPALRTGGRQPLIAGGDAAVVLDESQAGVDLLDWLTRPEHLLPWIEAGGYLSPLREAPTDAYPRQEQKLAEELATAQGLRFDLSDQLPGSFTGADGVGIWRILQQFLADVAAVGVHDRAAIDTAIQDATQRLDTAARTAGEEGGGM